jgi:hypothetical protein
MVARKQTAKWIFIAIGVGLAIVAMYFVFIASMSSGGGGGTGSDDLSTLLPGTAAPTVGTVVTATSTP